MSFFLLNVLLAIAWSALTGRFEPLDLGFGFVLGYVALWVISHGWGGNRYFRQIPRLIELALYFLADLVRANLRLAATILSPRMNLRPAVVVVPLVLQSEAAVIMLVNMVTLTPGTLALDISSDRRFLYIHAVRVDDVEQFRRQVVDGYERRLKELLEP